MAVKLFLRRLRDMFRALIEPAAGRFAIRGLAGGARCLCRDA